MVDVSVPCSSCHKPVHSGDDFCAACGAAVSADERQALRDRLEASNVDFFFHNKQANSARNTIGVVAALFMLGAGREVRDGVV
jgi:hypothetical protein